jgi:hypothetical protein
MLFYQHTKDISTMYFNKNLTRILDWPWSPTHISILIQIEIFGAFFVYYWLDDLWICLSHNIVDVYVYKAFPFFYCWSSVVLLLWLALRSPIPMYLMQNYRSYVPHAKSVSYYLLIGVVTSWSVCASCIES